MKSIAVYALSLAGLWCASVAFAISGPTLDERETAKTGASSPEGKAISGGVQVLAAGADSFKTPNETGSNAGITPPIQSVPTGTLKTDIAPQKPAKEFVLFASFIKATAAAKYADYKDREGVAVKSEKDFEAMKAHILDLYRGVVPTNSYLTTEGQYIDCIPFDQQPGLRDAPAQAKVKPVPPPLPGTPDGNKDGKKDDPAKKPPQVDKDQFGNARWCPPDSIPMLRVTLEKMTRSPTLDDALGRTSKKGPPGIR
jgi:hypothetical protein